MAARRPLLVLDKKRGSLRRLVPALRKSGYQVSFCDSEANGFKQAKANSFAAILLGRSFADLVPKLKRHPKTRETPLLMVARPEYSERGATVRSWPQDDLLFPPLTLAKIRLRLQRAIKGGEIARDSERVRAGIQALGRISRAMRAEPDDVTILNHAARELETLIPGVTCSVVLLDEGGEAGYIVTQGDRPQELNIRIELQKYPELRRAIEIKQTLVIRDVTRSPLMKEVLQFIQHKPLQSSLVTPIIYRDEIIGLLFVRSEKERRTFTPTEIYFLELIANTSASAVKNLRLSRSVQSEMRGRARAERNATQLAQSSRRLEALFAHASDGILVVDPEGIITDLNENFVRMSGYAKAEAQGRSLDQVLLPETERAKPLSRILRGGRTARHANARLLCRDHSERLLTAHFQPLPGPRDEFLISLLDMTEERQLSLELRRTKEFLEKVIQGTMDAIIAADLKGKVLLFNEGAEAISGYPAEEVIGKINIVDLYAPGVARDVMRKLRSPDYGGVGKLETCSNTLLGKSGEEIPINMSASIIYEDGREIASVGIFHDLRDRIKIEKELREAQERLMESRRREALVALAGAAAHQLNQPLTSILGYAEILKRVERSFYELAPQNPALASLKNAVKAIAESAERMATVVRKIGETAEFKTQTYLGDTQIVDLDQAGGDRARELPEAAYLESVMELAPEAVLVIGEDTIINRANPAARTLTGEEPVGHSFTRYLQGIAHAQGMSAFEKVRQGQRVEFELELTRPGTGERRLTRNLGIPIPGRNEFLALFSDVTEPHRAEQERQWLASFQSQILEAAGFPVLTLDLDRRITFWNRACEHLLGYAADEVSGQKVTMLEPADRPQPWTERLRELRGNGLDDGRLELLRQDGSRVQVQYLATLLRSDPGDTLGYCLFLRDLTQREAGEQALARMEDQLRVSREVVEAFRCQGSLEEALGMVYARLHTLVPFQVAALVFPDPEEDALTALVPDQEGKVGRRLLRVGSDRDLIDRIFLQGGPQVFEDISALQGQVQSADLKQRLGRILKRGIRAMICLPLQFQDEVLGGLVLASDRPGSYGQAEISLLAPVVGQLALALAHAKLDREAQEQREALLRRSRLFENLIRAARETPINSPLPKLLDSFCQPLLEVFPRAHLSIAFRPPQARRLHYAFLGNLPQKYLDQPLSFTPEFERELVAAPAPLLLCKNDPRFAPLMPESESMAVFPLRFEGRLLGAMLFESHHDPPFSSSDLALLQVLGLHLSAALGNYYLYEQIRRFRGFQEALIENANALILVLDHRGRVAVFNRAFHELLGRSREQAMGRTMAELTQEFLRLEPEGSLQELTERVNRGEPLVNQRVRLLTASGQEVEAVFNTATLRDPSGAFQGFVAIGQDITRLRQLEAQLLHSEKLASLGQMAASIAHELNNPLTAISSYAQILLRSKAGLPEEVRERMQRILEEANRIESLVKNLISYARPSAGEMTLLHLGEVIQQALTFTRYQVSKGDIRIVTRIPEELPLIRGVKDQLQQVFINLLTNASYACAQKGGGEVTISAQAAEQMLEVRVADNGIGIRPEHLEKIFEPFFTTKAEGQGTGLGLSIVKDIITRHQGQVRVQSRSGEGAEFIILLPLAG